MIDTEAPLDVLHETAPFPIPLLQEACMELIEPFFQESGAGPGVVSTSPSLWMEYWNLLCFKKSHSNGLVATDLQCQDL